MDAAVSEPIRLLTGAGDGAAPTFDRIEELLAEAERSVEIFMFVWRNDEIDKVSKSRQWTGEAPQVMSIKIPVYLNSSFRNLLFDVSVPVFSALPVETWVQRAVSLSVWSN